MKSSKNAGGQSFYIGSVDVKIIINADDFGYSHSVNLAIVEAFRRGYITNTTVMVNMPGFDESVSLAKEHGFFDKVGLHLNLLEGQPLTSGIKRESLFYTDGQMSSYKIFRNTNQLKRFFLPKHTVSAIYEETAAQMCKYMQAGFTQFHLDSHKHSHTIISVFLAVRSLIKKNKFRTIRKSLNLFANRPFLVKLYKYICNKLISNRMTTTKYFTSASEFIQVMQSGFTDDSAICEIMVHPVFQDGKLVNANNVDFETLFEYLDKNDLLSYLEI